MTDQSKIDLNRERTTFIRFTAVLRGHTKGNITLISAPAKGTPFNSQRFDAGLCACDIIGVCSVIFTTSTHFDSGQDEWTAFKSTVGNGDFGVLNSDQIDLYDVEMEMMKKVGHINPDNRMGFQWWPVQQGIDQLSPG